MECVKELCATVYDKYVHFRYNNCGGSATRGDMVCEYSVQLLRLGCFYLEFSDAIREGDGSRVLRC